ncbi:PREDICTED: uncharacterized protein LOC109154493 [Ipomoea nil]|uniref:uncharacterized protein LOC109154493 n=1 Tax=Ipomoea nil TaxID=35883 RepID=UPI0009015CB1|nr:PREDICTED: uncharacterized protein LOC109154493 [Ipomoea nil]
MRVVENDDASSFIDPSADNFPSPEQAQPPPYAASPFPTRWLFNHGGLTWNPVTEMETADNDAAAAAALTESEMSEEGETTSVVHHLQTDSHNHSVNTECNLVLDMAGGMMMSPPGPGIGMNFSGEEALFLSPNFHADMGGGMMMSMSPPWINYFSLPSGDSMGNFDPFRLCDFADHSEVQELENRNGMMMRPTWKQQPCIEEVDAASASALGQNQSLGIWSAALEEEAENMGGMVQPQTSDDHSVNNVDAWFQLAGLSSQTMINYSLPSDDSGSLGGNKPGLPGVTPCLIIVEWLYKKIVIHSQSIELKIWGCIMGWISLSQRLWFECCSNPHLWRLVLGFLDVVVTLLLHIETNNYSFGNSVTDDRSSSSLNAKMLRLLYLNGLDRQFLDHFDRLVQTGVLELPSGEEIKLPYLQEEEEVGTASQKNHSVSILPEMLEPKCWMMQLDSPCEFHIPKSSATNEERNVVVGLKRTDAIGKSWKRKGFFWWLKDHGISHKILESLFVRRSTFKQAHRDFGITRRSLEEVGTASEENHTADIWPALEAEYNAARRGGMLLEQEDSSSEAHIPESNATNEERNNSIDAKGGNSSSQKTDTISRWEKNHGITLPVLEQLFGKSRDNAAKTLKVSSSTLKRACRDFGINRWPNHKGKMPNCSLNQIQYVQAVKKCKGIQPCPALPPLQATNTSQCNSTMSVKVTYKNDTIRFPLSSSSTLKYLEEQLESKFKISLENMSIKYQDEEDEWITLMCDSGLMHGLDVLRSCGKTIIRMMVTPKLDYPWMEDYILPL